MKGKINQEGFWNLELTSWMRRRHLIHEFFCVMPGNYYGRPKNALHQVGIPQSILNIKATLKPHPPIFDEVTGMEGEGPILAPRYKPKSLLMGKNLPAVDPPVARLWGSIHRRSTTLIRPTSDWAPFTNHGLNNAKNPGAPCTTLSHWSRRFPPTRAFAYLKLENPRFC